jgi:hypothetical protein
LANKSKPLLETQVLEIPIAPSPSYVISKKEKKSVVHQNSFTGKYFILESSFELVAINFSLRGVEKRGYEAQAGKDKKWPHIRNH